MSTDTTRFDKCLKKELWRDLLFRLLLWVLVSIGACYVAVGKNNISILDNFRKVGEGSLPLINFGGCIVLILCFVALYLKDVEVLGGSVKKFASENIIAGLVRRIAGDFSLWVIGALVFVFVVLVFTFLFSETDYDDFLSVLGIGAQLLFLMLCLSIVNIFVRREGPTFVVRYVRGYWCITGVYLAFFIILFILAVLL